MSNVAQTHRCVEVEGIVRMPAQASPQDASKALRTKGDQT